MMSSIYLWLFNHAVGCLYPTVFLLLVLVIYVLSRCCMISKLLLLLGIIYFYFSANGIIPIRLMTDLEIPFHPIERTQILKHHAMIVLGGGLSQYPPETHLGIFSYARILEAYRIYKLAAEKNIQYTIFLSGGYTTTHHDSEASVYKKILLQFGVPEKNIVLEDKSVNTYQNAEYLTPILKRYPFKNYLLVTSAVHMRRAIQYFNKFDIHTVAAPSDFPYPDETLIPKAYNLMQQQMVLTEYFGIIRLKLYDYLSMNVPLLVPHA
jgi:uncharacterized SAM-binding protein YcdF (DUF218 family)